MEIAQNIDRLIGSLQTFKAVLPKISSAQTETDFEELFAKASVSLEVMDEGSIEDGEGILAPKLSQLNLDPKSLAAFKDQNLLVDQQSEAVSGRPNVKEFMEATGVSAVDASEILYGVIGANADLRNWDAIMASDNPVDAARAATRQLYNSDKEYALLNHHAYGTPLFDAELQKSSLSSKTVIQQNGNFSEIENLTGHKITMATSNSGLILRGVGTSQSQLERTAWLFGFELPEDVV